MKKYKFVGVLTYYRRLNCSVYGNPAFYGEFTAPDGESIEGRTKSNAACGFSFLNQENKPREVTYHLTRAGNIVFDYIKVLEA